MPRVIDPGRELVYAFYGSDASRLSYSHSDHWSAGVPFEIFKSELMLEGGIETDYRNGLKNYGGRHIKHASINGGRVLLIGRIAVFGGRPRTRSAAQCGVGRNRR